MYGLRIDNFIYYPTLNTFMTKLTVEDLKNISSVKFADQSGKKFFDTVYKIGKDGKIQLTSGFLTLSVSPADAIDTINDLAKTNKMQITYKTPSTNKGYKTYKPKHSIKSPRTISQLENSVRKMF